MTQRMKSLLIIGLTLGCLMLVLLGTSRFILLESFASLEERTAQRHVERAAHALRDDIANINTVAGDYAGWDDAYRFVQNGNQDFVRINLAEAIYSKLRLNLLIYLNSAGGIVYSRAFDFHREKPIPMYRSILQHIVPGSLLVRHDNPDSVRSGIIMLPEGAMLIASRPVLTSEYKGPVRGTIIMGRILDEEESRRISEAIRLPILFSRFDASGVSPDIAAARAALSAVTPNMVRQRGSAVISGYYLFQDIYGKPAMLARIDMPREIMREGVQTIRYFVLWFFFLSLGVFVCSHVLVSRMVLARRKKEDTERRYRVLVEQAAEGIVLADPRDIRLLESNEAFRSLLGYSFGEAMPPTLPEMVAEGDGLLEAHVQRALSERRPLRFELCLKRKDRSAAITEVSVAVINMEEHELLSFVVHDITDRKRFEQELMYQANHDALTGLASRNILLDRLNQALAVEGRFDKQLAVLLLDLDNFKIINDTLGHAAGDRLLINVAERLRGSMRRYDTVARLGGDEFSIVLTEIDDTQDVVMVANKLMQLFTLPFEIDGKDLFVTVSVGIALSPSDGNTAEILLKNADAAVYHVKERGKNSYMFFSAEMNRKAYERLDMETRLRRALEREEFLLHYQPRVSLSTGRIVGAEALIRWNDPENGLVAPYKFIPLLEETGLIIPVGEWVLRTACAQTRAWLGEGMPSLQMAVNLSARQFHQHDLVGTVTRVLEESGLNPRHLELELTESILMQDVEETIGKLAALKEMGIKLAIDDFGTGYSSLGYLKRFPLDQLKIDQSFVRDLTVDPDDATIVTTIIAMAHSLKLHVVAEGVETVEQLAFLIEHQCEELQGYYFSKPLPTDQFEDLMKSGRQLVVEYDRIITEKFKQQGPESGQTIATPY